MYKNISGLHPLTKDRERMLRELVARESVVPSCMLVEALDALAEYRTRYHRFKWLYHQKQAGRLA